VIENDRIGLLPHDEDIANLRMRLQIALRNTVATSPFCTITCSAILVSSRRFKIQCHNDLRILMYDDVHALLI
jgi:hypothetical protein